MAKSDKINRNNRSMKLQKNKVSTTVLVAAAALLGTSLGVSAAAPDEPTGVKGAASPITAQRTPVDRTILAEVKVKVPSVPAVKQPKIQSSFQKVTTVQSNQIKDTGQPHTQSNQEKHSLTHPVSGWSQ
jgi:hypothetical protein